ncbi:MAG: LysR family transcriptional regulator [Myxococcota bacterium]
MDRLEAIQTFVKIIDLGSFTAAADHLGFSKSHASKLIHGLEQHLGVGLLNRTTRQMSPTDAGRAFYQRCLIVLEELEEAERSVTQLHQSPRGILRMTAPMSWGYRHLAPILGRFMSRYPELEVELQLTDRMVDMVDEGFDMAIRIGELEPSSLMARRLAPVQRVVCASPEYVERHGRPTHPDELRNHACLLYTLQNTGERWRFQHIETQRESQVAVSGPLRTNSGETLEMLATQGIGIALLPDFLIADQVRQGRLEVLLTEWSNWNASIWVLYPPNRHLSAKVRMFIDTLVEAFKEGQPNVATRP